MPRCKRFTVFVGLAAVFALLVCCCPAADPAPAAQGVAVENARLSALVDPQTGTLRGLKNKMTDELYALAEETFALQTDQAAIGFKDVQLVSLDLEPRQWTAQYQQGDVKIEAVYALGDHFVEKRLAITFPQPVGLVRVEVSRPVFAAAGLKLRDYGYPKFQRKAGEEPCHTFFGRTEKGGLLTGIEMPFAECALAEPEVRLAFAPNLKLAAGEKFDCEPVYFGVFTRLPGEAESDAEPLRSESDAMVALTSAVLGPPRHTLAPMVCGYHSEMNMGTYASQADVEADIKSIDFVAECGLDWACEGHPWGGEIQKINELTGEKQFEIGALTRQFLNHAREAHVKVALWSTITNSNPWSGLGRAFRPDKPEWRLQPDLKLYTANDFDKLLRNAQGNCVANRPFMDWLSQLDLEDIRAGDFPGWGVDGDFFGTGGWFTTVVPVTCLSGEHDHLPGKANYACQRALDRLNASVRRQNPQAYIFACRPAMDLGVWALRNTDACFTLLENGTPAENIAAGDGIRKWSRIRLHHDFFPHYVDWPLLFPSCAGGAKAEWSSAHLDYALLSALSSSTNQLFYLPTKKGIPAADKQTIRRWLDWGREHVKYLQVRKDLADWPAADKVDGSAHILDDGGFVFLFNGAKEPRTGQFALSADSIGLGRGERFGVREHYPGPDREVAGKRDEPIRWQVPPETVVVLEIRRTE